MQWTHYYFFINFYEHQIQNGKLLHLKVSSSLVKYFLSNLKYRSIRYLPVYSLQILRDRYCVVFRGKATEDYVAHEFAN